MLRRLALTATVSLAALVAAPSAYACHQHPTAPQPPDRLTVTGTGADGTTTAYELECAPAGGTHPSADEACEVLEQASAEGRDLFAPVPEDALCTMQYGGPETARVTGTWHGRPVGATYDRTNGCEISRWDSLGAVLPAAGA
ncbi:SSI family serine proteinase inhibitor [Streptomyces sp. E11-3]|uniref:SSI family serine proteinase inhibitor n=1 Tax=Streptomyces sp. E11-3 TaxID=3110112 RepID=UPI0039804F48